ncbi:hypothetical protein P691DRAFT_790080 [Macrolepiota fuliginosa MF-IS2]|uniref:Uncharacterized protein n=1 Tax=Macrolepiota fuliginosa MF-IS2 TaxID=1400762 RepID=A0A9P5X2I2_9AGAR|nr:hypothetical protein P691DRAFT_790080 [Macrolepiota fuliginosa MF-IS2]
MWTSIGEWMSPKEIDSIINNNLYSKEEKLEIIFESYGVNNDQCKELLQYAEELTTDVLVFDDNSSQYRNMVKLAGQMFREYAPDSKAVHSRTDYQLIGSEGVHFMTEEDEVSIIKNVFLPRWEDEDNEEYTQCVQDQTKVLTIVNAQSQ